MSGGSLDYAYSRVEEIASAVRRQTTTPLQRAFSSHLEDVAEALYALEWVWSGDWSEGEEEERIKVVLTPEAELNQATKELRVSLKALLDLLEEEPK